MDPEQFQNKQTTPIKDSNPLQSRELNTNHKSHDKNKDQITEKIQNINLQSQEIEKMRGSSNKVNRQRIHQELDKPQQKQQNISKLNKLLRFHTLPQKVNFFITEVYQHFKELFINGMMENGQPITMMCKNTLKDLYFCLRRQNQNSIQISQNFKNNAKDQILDRLKKSNIKVQHWQWEEKSYCFQISQIPMEKRPYFRVRYIAHSEDRNKQTPKADWQGKYYKYVFGTTYTPLETFIINTGIKGPQWVFTDKLENLVENREHTVGETLTMDIVNCQNIYKMKQQPKIPRLRVMSISARAVIPQKVKIKRLFPNDKIQQSQIYVISYHICQNYDVEVKPQKPFITSQTFFLKQFGLKAQRFVSCQDQKDLLQKFMAKVRYYDPDFLVCHDATTVLDLIFTRYNRLINKKGSFGKSRISRLLNPRDYGTSLTQMQKINGGIAGRLLVDTFIHSKDMIKQVDYSLQAMSRHIKPAIKFKSVSQQQIISLMNSNKLYQAVNAAFEESRTTFHLMNHLQIIQMTKSLTNICGNTWKRSLQLQRSQRNQFLMMHQCKARDIIIPDKFKLQSNQGQQQGDKKKYTGGLVLNPQTGMYNDFILLLDFNSLYPSLIRQYNICFTKINRPKLLFSSYYKTNEKKKKITKQESTKQKRQISQLDVKPPPKEQCQKSKWGFLPILIDKIVEKRKQCKKQIKKASLEKAQILDIQQKSYKIVANSIYGCLGFKFNRFYSQHLAALVTRMGRQALMRAKDIVQARGTYRVIYGDTDSLMLQPNHLMKETNKQKILQIEASANQLKKQINKQYSNLQIDIDGIYKPLILLQKKKYVANKLQNFESVVYDKKQPIFKLQYKGVQVVRRDGCNISRQVLKDVINILMKGQKTQLPEIQQQIVQYFEKLNQGLDKQKFDNFLLANFLSKKISQYGNAANNLSHVKVAKDRVNKGQKQQQLVGHAIYYIICQPQDPSQDSFVKRSWSDKAYDQSQKTDKPLKIDMNYYKQEILKPVARILGTVKIEMQRIFDVMGIQSLIREKLRKFVINQQAQDFNPLHQDNILQVILNKDFAHKQSLIQEALGKIKCCDEQQSLLKDKKFRTNCVKCSKLLIHVIQNKISLYIKKQVSEYYNNNFKCKCGREFILTPLKCCHIKNQEKNNIPYTLHDTLYLIKQIAESTIKDMMVLVDRNIGDKRHIEKMNNVQRIIEDFLQSSEFQDVSSLMSNMKF